MLKISTSKILALISAVLCLSAFLLFSPIALAAGTSGGASGGQSQTTPPVLYTPVFIDDAQLVQDILSGKYKGKDLMIVYTKANHTVSKALADAINTAQNDPTIAPKSIGFEFPTLAATTTGDNFVRWNFPVGFPLEGFELEVKATRIDQFFDPAYTQTVNAFKAHPTMIVDFTYSGVLAKPVTVTYVEDSTEYLKKADTFVYFCPANSSAFEEIAKNVSYSNGYTVTLTHMSPYAFSTATYSAPTTPGIGGGNGTSGANNSGKNAKSNNSTTTGNNNSSTNGDSINYNPTTGPADSIASILPLSLLALSAAFVSKKK